MSFTPKAACYFCGAPYQTTEEGLCAYCNEFIDVDLTWKVTEVMKVSKADRKHGCGPSM